MLGVMVMLPQLCCEGFVCETGVHHIKVIWPYILICKHEKTKAS